jgi:hypothetical protein
MHEPSFAGTDGETIVSPGDAPARCQPGGTGPRRAGWRLRYLDVFYGETSPRLSGPMRPMAKSEIVWGLPTGTEDVR